MHEWKVLAFEWRLEIWDMLIFRKEETRNSTLKKKKKTMSKSLGTFKESRARLIKLTLSTKKVRKLSRVSLDSIRHCGEESAFFLYLVSLHEFKLIRTSFQILYNSSLWLAQIDLFFTSKNPVKSYMVWL